MVSITLDALGKKCPMPVLLAKKELKKMNSGEVLEVISDDSGSLKDIPSLLSKTGDELLDTTQDGEVITFTIKKI
ncbi:MAG: sulfurtransferase TusA family protein [Candidatus Lokiarchaeota archaeon]|nr:sulfurtransferase TusA family protein [Candidatus Lokiarchaeota archaeon]MBD3201518.1 sulfurtransferase TusA family protein [Candidatus Lokiarchaeota archaeon]